MQGKINLWGSEKMILSMVEIIIIGVLAFLLGVAFGLVTALFKFGVKK